MTVNCNSYSPPNYVIYVVQTIHIALLDRFFNTKKKKFCQVDAEIYSENKR